MDTDQLRAQLFRIAAADPVDQDAARDKIETRAASLRRKRRLRVSTLVAVSVAGIVALVFVVARPDGENRPTEIHPAQSTPVTTPRVVPTTSTAPATQGATSQLCSLQRDPADFYALAQPVTITLPDGNSIPIVPGNTLTEPERVTLDGDGSLPGDSGTAASLLWGAATDAGPFAGLQNASPGDTVILRQVASTECIQRWRVIQIVTSQDALTPSRPVLRLVGFTPNASGPIVQYYVEAVPE
jgi:hypothetical protein